MADFFMRMTQRTLGLRPVVQPFIASKYASESMGAAIAGGLTLIDPFPGQAIEDLSENWEEEAEHVPAVSISQSIVPREVRHPGSHVPGVSQSVALPQEQPSTTLLPSQGQSHSLVNTTSIPVNSPDIVSSQPQMSNRQENEFFSTASTTSTVPTLEPRPGQVNPSSQSHKLTVDKPHVPGVSQSVTPREVRHPGSHVPGVSQRVALPQEQSHPLPSTTSIPVNSPDIVLSQSQTSDQQENEFFSTAPTASTVPTLEPHPGQVNSSSRSNVGTRFIVTRTGEPLAPTRSEEIHRIPYASIQAVPYKSGEEEQHLSPSSEENSAYASIQATGHNEVSSVREIPSVTNFNSDSPALVSSSANTTGNLPANKRNVTNTRRINTEDTQTRLVPIQTLDLPSADSSTLVTGSDLVEPMFPSVYPSVQSGRMRKSAAGKREIAQPWESHEAPTIRVTIGRIDVRAVPPTPPASPAPTKSNRSRPALSLSDYLKQRKGGQP